MNLASDRPSTNSRLWVRTASVYTQAGTWENKRMKFEELAKELDDTYFRGYHEDRDKALGEFGRKYSSDLVAMERGTGPYDRGRCEGGTNISRAVHGEGN